MDSQIQIWILPNAPLRQQDWENQGFSSFAGYVQSLEEESKQGYKRNGKPAESGKNLPLLSVGFLDSAAGVKKTVAVYPSYEDLPTESLSYDESSEGSIMHYDLIQFTDA